MAPQPSINYDDVLWKSDEGQLAVDVIETPEHILVRSAIAGVKEKDLDIHVNEDMVTIRGERQTETLAHNATVHYAECFWGSFSRSIILPSKVKADEAEATLKNGILLIKVPKAHSHVRVTVREEPNL
jgi:HSP20 family protein